MLSLETRYQVSASCPQREHARLESMGGPGETSAILRSIGGPVAQENGRVGLTLRQGVMLGVIAYTAITAFLLGRSYQNGLTGVTHNSKLHTNIHGNVANSLLEENSYDLASDETANSLDDSFNSSGLRVGHGGVNDDMEDAEDQRYSELRNNLYHSSVVFGLNYEEMLSMFKIYVYPGEDYVFKGASGVSSNDDIHFTEDFFMHSLYQSDFITLDAEKAQMFLIPISLRALLSDAHIGPSKIGRFLNKYVQGIRDDYPYWQRTLGADHVFVTCKNYREDGSRNGLELKKNVIQIACYPPEESEIQSFYPHKDVSMPEFQINQNYKVPQGMKVKRTNLAYYRGEPTDESFALASFEVPWMSDPSFVVDSPDSDKDMYESRLGSSKFCLIIVPKNSAMIVDALRLGCVPVLISTGRLHDLPFQDILNWNKFAVIISQKKAQNLKNVLSQISEENYSAMQFLGKEASKHMAWHFPPQDQDAFYMVLYDLWIRRHAIRYTRRDDL